MNLSKTLTAAATAALALAFSTASLSPAHADAASTVAKKKYGVTATANKTEVLQDGKVKITGTVTPAARGARVILERKYDDGDWKKTQITDKLDGQGDFRLTDVIGSGESRSYRVLMPASRTTKAGRSKVLPVVVYSWRDLSSLTTVRHDHTYAGADIKMNGVLYPNSVLGSAASSGGTDYNLERKCRQLDTVVGIADTSATTATGTAFLRADGVQQYAGSFTLTQTATVSLPLTDVFRFTFDWTSTNTAGTPEDQSGAAVALGSPRILCRD